MTYGERMFAATSALLFAAGGYGLYRAEQDHNAVVNACTDKSGQEIDECLTPPASELKDTLEHNSDIELVLGIAGLAVGGAGLMSAMDKISQSKSVDKSQPPGRVIRFRPRHRDN